MFKFFWAIMAFCFSAAAQAQSFDPLTGIRVSLENVESQLAALPLPSLEGGTFSEPGSASYLVGECGGAIPNTPNVNLSYSGKFYGAALGLGYSSAAHSSLRRFSLITASQLNGNINIINQSGSTLAQLSNMKTSGLAVMTGYGLRLIGEDSSVFAAGLFAGPAAMYFASTFDITNSFSGTNTFSSNPLSYGGLIGAQFKVRIGYWLLNPYGLYFADASNPTKSYSSPSGNGTANLSANFTGVGVCLGYHKFIINLYSQVFNNADFAGIVVHNYQVSGHFDF